MNFTIMCLEDAATEQKLILDKNGNKYNVGLYDQKLFSDEIYTIRNKDFNTLNEAMECFLNGTVMIGKGIYSYKDRCSMLFN